MYRQPVVEIVVILLPLPPSARIAGYYSVSSFTCLLFLYFSMCVLCIQVSVGQKMVLNLLELSSDGWQQSDTGVRI